MQKETHPRLNRSMAGRKMHDRMKLFRGKMLNIGFASALLVMIIISAVSYISVIEHQRTDKKMQRSYNIIKKLDELYSMINDVEIGQRDYIITGREDYLKSYYDTGKVMEQHLMNLRGLLFDNVAQQKRLDALAGMIKAKLAELNKTIELRKNKSLDAALNAVRTNSEKETTDGIRKTVREMMDEEKELLNVLTDKEEVVEEFLISVIMSGSIMVVIIIALSMATRKYEGKKRRKAEDNLQQALQELKALSLTDDFTDAYNRRGFLTLGSQLFKMANRLKKGILMLFIDLDDLKWINDNLGHKEGGMALIYTANILKKTFRESDIIARMGGDEFAVIAIEESGTDAEVVINQLLKNIDAHNAEANRRYKLSLSFGIVRNDPEMPLSIDELLVQADKLMYEHKRSKKKNTSEILPANSHV